MAASRRARSPACDQISRAISADRSLPAGMSSSKSAANQRPPSHLAHPFAPSSWWFAQRFTRTRRAESVKLPPMQWIGTFLWRSPKSRSKHAAYFAISIVTPSIPNSKVRKATPRDAALWIDSLPPAFGLACSSSRTAWMSSQDRTAAWVTRSRSARTRSCVTSVTRSILQGGAV